MKTYKTKDGSQTGIVPGVGIIANGQITVPDHVVIQNANFELVMEKAEQTANTPPAAPVAPGASSMVANPVTLDTVASSPVAQTPTAAPTSQPANQETK